MIRRTFNKIVRWAMNYNDNRKDSVLVDCDSVRSNKLNASGLNFTIFSASGGHIVEYRHYDTKSNESINNLHIITSDQDIGERIGQIVTIEILRNH